MPLSSDNTVYTTGFVSARTATGGSDFTGASNLEFDNSGIASFSATANGFATNLVTLTDFAFTQHHNSVVRIDKISLKLRMRNSENSTQFSILADAFFGNNQIAGLDELGLFGIGTNFGTSTIGSSDFPVDSGIEDGDNIAVLNTFRLNLRENIVGQLNFPDDIIQLEKSDTGNSTIAVNIQYSPLSKVEVNQQGISITGNNSLRVF